MSDSTVALTCMGKELCPHTPSLGNRILGEEAPQESHMRGKEARSPLHSRGDPSRQKLARAVAPKHIYAP